MSANVHPIPLGSSLLVMLRRRDLISRSLLRRRLLAGRCCFRVSARLARHRPRVCYDSITSNATLLVGPDIVVVTVTVVVVADAAALLPTSAFSVWSYCHFAAASGPSPACCSRHPVRSFRLPPLCRTPAPGSARQHKSRP